MAPRPIRTPVSTRQPNPSQTSLPMRTTLVSGSTLAGIATIVGEICGVKRIGTPQTRKSWSCRPTSATRSAISAKSPISALHSMCTSLPT